jgi:alanyl-tRNA synthetase
MTERLYYHDPDLLEFDAAIVAIGTLDDNYYVELNRSAFYPTSGGQLHDTGALNGVPVVDVIESPEGNVRHVARNAPGNVGDTVHGRIDSARRLRNRQMHTAQHILSQLFIRYMDAKTVSVHLGEEYGAVELDVEKIEDDKMVEIERAANEFLWAAHPVDIIFADDAEIARMPLRKVPQRKGKLRVIKIDELDYSACGGTHCRNTAQVGIIKLVGQEKLRGHVLVKFLSGIQAVEDYAKRYDVSDRLSRALTCSILDLEENVNRILGEHKSLRKELATLHRELIPVRSVELASRARPLAKVNAVVEDVSHFDASIVNELAGDVAARVNGIAILAVGSRLVIAICEGSRLHAGQLVKQFVARTGLKGGGSNRQAQVGGADPKLLDQYAKLFESFISNV